MGTLVGGLANVLDPDLVILTGGVSRAGPVWWSAVRRSAYAELLPAMRDHIAIDTLVVGSTVADAALIGAATLARGVAR